jgi:Dolichyl-phosphate-mannose-protein mannosyltransferase
VSGFAGGAAPARPPALAGHSARLSRHARSLSAAVQSAAAALAFAYLAAFVYVASRTLRYPFPLEWLEGGTLAVVQRILDGKPLYVAPSIEYVPYIYTPLYHYAAAAAAGLLGLDFFAPRLVSFVASLGCGYMIYRICVEETGEKLLAFCGAGLFFAMFDSAGKWFHLARVDSLNLLFLLIAVYLVRFRHGAASGLGVAAAFGLAFWTKQSSLLVAVPILAVMAAFDRGRAPVAIVAFLAALVIPAILLHESSDAWSTYFLFELPRSHEIDWQYLLTFWSRDLAGEAGLALCLAMAALAVTALLDRTAAVTYGAIFLGFVGSAWAARLHSGSFQNVVIPAYAILSILAPIGIARLRDVFSARIQSDRARGLAHIAIGPVLVMQFLALAYNPQAALPSQADRAAGERFLADIAAMDGDILLPDFPFVPNPAGKTSYGLGMAASDVLRGPDSRGQRALKASLAEAIRARRFSVIVLNDRGPVVPPALHENYRFARRLFDDRMSFIPVTGWPTRPNLVFVPIDAPA